MIVGKKLVAVILALSFLFSVSSCLGAVSLEKYGYVLTVGVDKGTQYKYNVSFLLESEVSEGGAEQGSSSKVNVISADGDNIYAAIYLAESGLPFRLNFSRANYIVVNYDIAADNDILEFFSTSWSMMRVRTSANMIVSKCTAREFIQGLSYSKDVNVTKLETSLIDFYEVEGLTSMMSITDFMSAVSSSHFDAVLPLGSVDNSIDKFGDEKSDTTGGIYRSGGMVSYTIGSALFTNSVLCGVLTGRETQLLLLMQGKLQGAMVQFTRDDGTNYTVKISNSERPHVETEVDGDKIRLNYYLMVSAVLVQESSLDMMDRMRIMGKLDESMEEQIKTFIHSSCHGVFEECRKLNCDALGTGKYVCKEFDTVKEWEEFDYKTRFSTVECDFDVNIDIQDIYVSTYLE